MLSYRMFTKLLSWMVLCARSDTKELAVSGQRCAVQSMIVGQIVVTAPCPTGTPTCRGVAREHKLGDRVGGVPDTSLDQAFGALSGWSRASTGAG